MRRRLLLAAAVVLAALATAQAASALTRPQATAAALKVLRPQAEKAPVVVFALPSALPASAVVTEGGTATADKPRSAPGVRVGRRAWLFWEDKLPHARFEHASRLVLIDDSTGRVVRDKALLWQPLVNNRLPAFLATPAAYDSSSFRVFSSIPAVKAKATRSTAGVPEWRSVVFDDKLPANAFDDDCMITTGLRNDPSFKQDFIDLEAFASRIGLRAFHVSGNPPTGKALAANINHLVDVTKCKDIFIYLDGHGYKRGTPAVTTGKIANADGSTTTTTVTAKQLYRITLDHPRTTFKIKIDSCYSGRFQSFLSDAKNVIALETSSAADEPSWSTLTEPVTEPDGTVVNPGDVRENDGHGEFTNGNLAGLEKFVTSQAEVTLAVNAGGSFLAHMLARAYDLGAGSDFARVIGLTHPQLTTRTPPVTGPAPPPPPTPLTADATASYHHFGPGSSQACLIVTGTKGATVKVTATSTHGFSSSETATIGDSGTVDVTFPIFEYDTYSFDATVQLGSQTVHLTKTVDVTPAQGPGCP